MHLSAAVGGKKITQTCVPWESRAATAIGPFTVTAHPVDHSALDAHALQIDVEGQTIMYSGDFRAHGWQAGQTEALMQNPPRRVDVLIMEGTNLPAQGSPLKPTAAEAELEEKFVKLFDKCPGRVFVSWSATNIDRTITLYNACKRSRRVLVPDLFCMLVLMRLKDFNGEIPQPDWKGGRMRAVVTYTMSRLAKRLGVPKLVEELKRHKAAIGAKALAADSRQWVIMARKSLLEGYASKGVIPDERDAWVWSMWNGYLKRESSRPLLEFFAPCQRKYIHSSGHASPDILQKFAQALRPKMLVPVHGENWPAWAEHFPNLRLMADGEWLAL
jgi:ribonuclease J